MPEPNHKHHDSIRMPLSLSIIFGAFTLGFYVAIQGPTLMDLIDILHVNNDIMSHSLAVASLAYSLGGLLSGIIFEYVDRQVLIPGFYIIFGLANMFTPYITNYYVFSVITVFKMMCAGGTDCGANVWILDMWPGKDAWLQALHFSFAIGCALGPLVVEPFLSAGEHAKDSSDGGLAFDSNGQAVINGSTESRIYIPYGVSGALTLIAAVLIIWLRFLEAKRTREDEQRAQQKQLMLAEQIPLTVMLQDHGHTDPADPTAIAGDAEGALTKRAQAVSSSHVVDVPETIPEEAPLNAEALGQAAAAQQASGALAIEAGQSQQQQQQQQQVAIVPRSMKFSSKARERAEGRPPYYVMFAITLAAMCLSFYCGIEITSMNYLATFAVNIDLQLPKSTAALMSSALTFSFAVGRGFGIWIAAYMRPHKLFYLCATVMTLGNVCILFCANISEVFLWCSICMFGIGCGPMYASIVSFYDDKISKVTNTVSGIFILGSMFNVALNTVIIGHYIIDNALILIVCNLMCAAFLMCIFGSLHLLTKIKMRQRRKKFLLQQRAKKPDPIKVTEAQQSDQSHPSPPPPTPPPSLPQDQHDKRPLDEHLEQNSKQGLEHQIEQQYQQSPKLSELKQRVQSSENHQIPILSQS